MFRSLIAFTLLAFVPAAVSGAVMDTRDSAQCVCDAYFPVPLYRAYNARITDHFYTMSLPEVTNAGLNGWGREGDVGRVLASDAPGAIPLYRLWSSSLGDHFYTTNAAERVSVLTSGQWTDEGIAAYVLAQPACGTVPLYRTFQGAHFDHFYTADAPEMANAITKLGYTFEAVIGYIWPNA